MKPEQRSSDILDSEEHLLQHKHQEIIKNSINSCKTSVQHVETNLQPTIPVVLIKEEPKEEECSTLRQCETVFVACNSENLIDFQNTLECTSIKSEVKVERHDETDEACQFETVTVKVEKCEETVDTDFELKDVPSLVKKEDLDSFCGTITEECDLENISKNEDADWFGSIDKGHERPFKCQLCDYRSTRKECLQRHVRFRHYQEKPFSCEICGKKSARKADLMLHVKYKHTKERSFQCDQCGLQCVAKTDLLRHMQHVHSNEKPLSCDLCDYRCVLKSDLSRHINHKHTHEKPISCDQCDYKCDRRSYLISHIKVKHTNERSFACDQCTYRGATKALLSVHTKHKHPGEKPFGCDLCSYRGATKTLLDNHIKKKHTEPQKVCNECENKGTISGSSKQVSCEHKKAYPKKPPRTLFQCEQCDYATVYKVSLSYHVTSKHSQEKDFACQFCGVKFALKATLMRHIKRRQVHPVRLQVQRKG